MNTHSLLQRAIYPVLACLGAGFLSFAAVASADEPAAPESAATAGLANGGSKVAPVTAASAAVDAKLPSVENSVVKVFSVMRYPDVYKPWMKQSPTEATGSGVVIEGKRILTNAHVVLYASQVQIQANQAGDKISATVEMVAPGIDLAVLKLEDESFFDSHAPLPRANKIPDVKDPVMVYGYPTGGTSLSITKGIVSRIEFTSYNYPVSGLRIQLDAAINPGNSGGPAVAGSTMIGLAFSHLGGAENIGYIIPNEEIELFLKSLPSGTYEKPGFFDQLQTLENPVLRSFLKLDKSDHGIVIFRVDSDSPGYPLKKWDVISKVGDTDVDDQGMIHQGNDLRLGFTYLFQKLAKNGVVPMTVIRDKKRIRVDVPAPAHRTLLIPALEGAYPSYFVYGPIVFSSASAEFAGGLFANAPSLQGLVFRSSELVARRIDKPAFPGEQLVVVSSPFFPHKLAIGYDSPATRVLRSVNGVNIRNLQHLVEVLRDATAEYITFDFGGWGGETMIFPRREMLAATDGILTDNGVRSQASPDLLAVWQAKPVR